MLSSENYQHKNVHQGDIAVRRGFSLIGSGVEA